MWRRIRADGCEWEVRIGVDAEPSNAEHPGGDDILEFRCLDGFRPPRRLIVPSGAVSAMSEAQLQSAYRRALPIAGDHYGRPGKPMQDAGP